MQQPNGSSFFPTYATSSWDGWEPDAWVLSWPLHGWEEGWVGRKLLETWRCVSQENVAGGMGEGRKHGGTYTLQEPHFLPYSDNGISGAGDNSTPSPSWNIMSQKWLWPKFSLSPHPFPCVCDPRRANQNPPPGFFQFGINGTRAFLLVTGLTERFFMEDSWQL